MVRRVFFLCLLMKSSRDILLICHLRLPPPPSQGKKQTYNKKLKQKKQRKNLSRKKKKMKKQKNGKNKKNLRKEKHREKTTKTLTQLLARMLSSESYIYSHTTACQDAELGTD